MEKLIKIGQKVKAYSQKGQGHIIGKIEEIETIKGKRFVTIRPESGEGGNFLLDFVVRERILSIVREKDVVEVF